MPEDNKMKWAMKLKVPSPTSQATVGVAEETDLKSGAQFSTICPVSITPQVYRISGQMMSADIQ